MKRAGWLLALCLSFFLAGCSQLQIRQQEQDSVLSDVYEEKEQIPHEALKETGYAYQTLEQEEEKQLYLEILHSLKNAEDATQLTTLDDSLLKSVFDCVLADHPEIFYVDGYSTQVYKLGDRIKKMTFTGAYTVDKTQIEVLQTQIGETADSWIAGLDPNWDDYKKVKYLYETVIDNTEYDIDAADGQNILSVFLNGRSVCQGYAKAFQLLCLRAGISSVLASGSVNGVGHAWTFVCLDGEWYHVDPTWGDASWILNDESGPAETSVPDVNYDYFCVTTDVISQTHQPDERFVWPACTAVANQYYRREGLYLESADPEKIRAVIKEAVAAGKESITLQCSEDSVYQQVYEYLIVKQEILDLLSADRISYADSAAQRTITFWLT